MMESYFKSIFKMHLHEKDTGAVRLLRWRQAEILKKAKEQDDRINQLENDLEFWRQKSDKLEVNHISFP